MSRAASSILVAVGSVILGGGVGLVVGATVGGNMSMGYERGGLIGAVSGIVLMLITAVIWSDASSV